MTKPVFKLPFKLPASNLSQRTLSSLVLMPFVIVAIWMGGFLYNLMVIAAVMMGMFEWLRLTVKKIYAPVEAAGLVGLMAVLFVGWLSQPLWGVVLSVFATVALFYYAYVLDSQEKGRIGRALWVAAGMPYLALSGLTLIHLRSLDFIGLFAVVYLIAVVWGSDIGGYAVGCTVRGPKLWPQISPKKTWAGLLGGMFFAGVSTYVVAMAFGDDKPIILAGVALGLAVISQAGDFFESYVKRRAGAKDSGTLIPGHGGILDRIDGLLFAAMAMQALMLL